MRGEDNIKENIEVKPRENRLSAILDDDSAATVEAILFASPEPLSDKEIGHIVGCERRRIAGIVERLNGEYAQWGRSFRIEKFGNRYRFYTLSVFDKYIRRLSEIPRPIRLSKAALEVLSIVAYKQPVMRAEIERVRGINSDGVVRSLLEKSLIEVCKRSDGPGRPLLYGTTEAFLEFFGLADLSDLPVPEIQDEKRAANLLTITKPPENSGSAAAANEVE